jgi:hypothetical protein
MAIGDEFDPNKNGWSFHNWDDQYDPNHPGLSWDLYRRAYLAINPTQDPIEAPLDWAFYEYIFRGIANPGNCFGMSMLGLALYKYGGFMGFCGPASFYTGDTSLSGALGPDRTDLHAAINVMHGRQINAFAVQNVLDLAAAGHLNDAEAAYARIESGLGSGDYALLSIATTGLNPETNHAHTVIPYRVEERTPGTRVIHVWDPNRPYDVFKWYYDQEYNTIMLTSPTSWRYDQTANGTIKDTDGTVNGTVYDGSTGGWCFTIPISLQLHKGRQPFSVDFAATSAVTVYLSGSGAAVTQIEDDDGRRFYRSNRVHRDLSEIETDHERRLEGVFRWPWFGAAKGGEPPGEIFFVQRAAESPPLTVTVRGTSYRLVHAKPGHMLEVETTARAAARDRFRLEGFAGDSQALEIHTDGEKRPFEIHQLRADNSAGDWRSIRIRNARVTKADLRVRTHGKLEAVEVSSRKEKKEFDLEFRQYRSKKLASRSAGTHRVAAGKAIRLAPADWNALKKTDIGHSVKDR